MNNEKMNQMIDEAYDNHSKSLVDSITFSERDKYFKVGGLEFNSGYPNYIHFTKEEFINKIKTDSEFSERWGLKIEERELNTVRERKKYDIHFDDLIGEYEEHHITLDKRGVPRKIITITYNGTKIESYEN
jgi:hypothetical protein